MAQKVLVMGESGTGKSTSLRNLDSAITAIVNPVGKPLPFKGQGKFTMLNNEIKSSNIVAWMKGQVKAGKKIIIVDDFQYLLSIPYMNRIHEGGWDNGMTSAVTISASLMCALNFRKMCVCIIFHTVKRLIMVSPQSS